MDGQFIVVRVLQKVGLIDKMYYRILMYMIRLLERIKADGPRDLAVNLLYFIIFSHILLILLLLMHFNLFSLSDYVDKSASKYVYLPVVIPLAVLIYRWFNSKRVEKIIEKYKGRKVVTLGNTVLFIVLGILPFSIFLYLI